MPCSIAFHVHTKCTVSQSLQNPFTVITIYVHSFLEIIKNYSNDFAGLSEKRNGSGIAWFVFASSTSGRNLRISFVISGISFDSLCHLIFRLALAIHSHRRNPSFVKVNPNGLHAIPNAIFISLRNFNAFEWHLTHIHSFVSLNSVASGHLDGFISCHTSP